MAVDVQVAGMFLEQRQQSVELIVAPATARA
jgi:hypothetical protein